MEGNRRKFLNKYSSPQFKRKGGPRIEKNYDSAHEQSFEDSNSLNTVYRILCHSKRIGSVLGKGGNIVKALRVETQAQITVSDSVPGSVERVILVCSPSDKLANRQNAKNGDVAKKGDDFMEPHCAAQDALLRVHDRIAEEDLAGTENNGAENPVVTVRLLVSTNTVGCLLGRKGDVIQSLRSKTGANIRILPADHLPACSSSNDELVQILAKPAIAKKALYEVSTLLHLNPRKDRPLLSFSTTHASQGSHPSEHLDRNMLRPVNSSWWDHSNDAEDLRPMPWKHEYGAEFEPENFDSIAPMHDRESLHEFSMKILCAAEKIGGVIGRGGLNVKLLQQETGASIHVENISKESDERVIRVSSLEVLRDQRSQTIDAMLWLQNKTSNLSEKGSFMTRLLVPSSKVGCILGQGGNVINEMRRTTQADIRVFSKEDKPTCASEDDELVQISGSFGAARDALTEIALRLRTRYLRDAIATTAEPASLWSVSDYGSNGKLRSGGGGFPPSSIMGARTSGEYEHLKGGFHDYESPGYPVSPRASGYVNINDGKISSVSAIGGRQMAERAEFQDPYFADSVFGTPGHFSASQNLCQIPASSAWHFHYPPSGGGSDFSTPELFNTSRNAYQVPDSSAGRPYSYPQSGAYESFNSRPGKYPVSPQVHYQNIRTQQGSYQNASLEGSYRY